MNDVYEEELQALQREIETGGARPSVIDNRIRAMLSGGSATLAADLLQLLSDKAEYDEGMFSLIHAAETAHDITYVSALLSIFPALSASSPRWASIVLMRAMNNDHTLHELVRQLRDSPALAKAAVRSMCDRINEVSPEFLNKTVPVTLASM